MQAIGTYVETARKLSRSLASLLRKDRGRTVLLPATTGKPLSKSVKATNTIDNGTYDYDFSVVGNVYFYAVTHAYLNSADLIM